MIFLSISFALESREAVKHLRALSTSGFCFVHSLDLTCRLKWVICAQKKNVCLFFHARMEIENRFSLRSQLCCCLSLTDNKFVLKLKWKKKNIIQVSPDEDNRDQLIHDQGIVFFFFLSRTKGRAEPKKTNLKFSRLHNLQSPVVVYIHFN